MNIVSVSSGVASAYVWHLARRIDPTAIGLFADVNGEHDDNYRFLSEVHEAVGGELVTLDNDGRTIWDVFKEQNFLGNSRVDNCSRVLKREPALAWMKEHHPGAVVWFGIDWTEEHRYYEHRWNDKKKRWEERGLKPLYESHGFQVRCPMVTDGEDKSDALAWLDGLGIEPPLLTRLGFPHANCKGMCVKAGHKQARRLLAVLPDDFAWWENGEREVQVHIGKERGMDGPAPFAILRSRVGGSSRPLPLSELRQTEQGENESDQDGCSCFTPEWMEVA